MASKPPPRHDLPPELQKVLRIQEARLRKMRDKDSVTLLRDAVTAARNDLRARIARLQLSGGSPFTIYQHQAVIMQLDFTERMLTRKLGGSLKDIRGLASAQAAKDAHEGLSAAAKAYQMAEIAVPLPEVERLVRGNSKLRTIEDRRTHRGAAQYGRETVRRIELDLAHSLLAGETTDAAIARIQSDPAWQGTYARAETIVRTEFSEAYNGAKRVALDEVAKDSPGLWVMWSEHASGPRWAGPKRLKWPGPASPLDDRVGDDSLRLHGQMRRPGQRFVDPQTKKTFAHPPNRPNDRATLILVRP